MKRTIWLDELKEAYAAANERVDAASEAREDVIEALLDAHLYNRARVKVLFEDLHRTHQSFIQACDARGPLLDRIREGAAHLPAGVKLQ
jgi:hypothetical protein